MPPYPLIIEVTVAKIHFQNLCLSKVMEENLLGGGKLNPIQSRLFTVYRSRGSKRPLKSHEPVKIAQ